MSLPETFTMPELLLELARIKPAPVSRFAFPCPRCKDDSPGQPPVAVGLYTAEGLTRHLFEVHGETAK